MLADGQDVSVINISAVDQQGESARCRPDDQVALPALENHKLAMEIPAAMSPTNVPMGVAKKFIRWKMPGDCSIN
jgi:hypothetical protein